MEAIVAENVRRRYGDVIALDGVTLSVDRGEIFGLVGPNGAGKTTLVRALTGTTEAEGQVRVLGEPPQTVDRAEISLLPQNFVPADRLTARELLSYYAGLYDDPLSVDELLNTVGLAEAAGVRYENLSGGQQRRACVGTALVNDPSVCFLDEPTTGIDPAGRRALWAVLEDLAARGTTVFLTTHDMAEAEHLADRVGLLADGALLAIDAPAELVDRYGGAAQLRIETTTDRIPDLDYEAKLIDDTIIIGDVPATAVGDVVAKLENAGVEYGELTWTEPDLEDVYLTLTGTNGGGRS
ncbi:MAG: ABC transporter ATP-binding protein [Salinirussus sp.]